LLDISKLSSLEKLHLEGNHLDDFESLVVINIW